MRVLKKEEGVNISAKIKVSYTEEQELQQIVKLLQPVIKKYKRADREDRFNRAYIEIK